ncbi:3-oxoacyl-[acyl-carrier protein] reductase [Minicystis rosea]|nr:3-oxoacyl-[acyl-carrier protein] reductase [Minicystis rosea]
MGDRMLLGKVVLVTGAASGIGRASALLFAKEGARLVLSDRDASGEALAAEIRAAGGEASFVVADVAREADVAALVAEAVARFGRLDGAFNNAGLNGKMGPIHEAEAADFERVMGVNLKGVWLCNKHQIIQMLKQGSGSIVNNASVAALTAFPGLALYTATKHGVVGLTKAAALELAAQKVRVNAVCPGLVRTPLLDSAVRAGFASEEQMVAMEPMGRLGEPAEVAEVAAWLLSDRASFVTGHAMVVDGGYIAR